MCGIVGVFNLSNNPVSSNPPISPLVLKKMSNMIRHRGPDAEEYYVDENVSLAHRALNIRGKALKRQPMWNNDFSKCIALDGEIYNLFELRKEILRKQEHVSETSADARILIQLYEKLGDHFVREIDGMFALVIYDKRRQKLFLARDRMGTKPMYYLVMNNRLVFASEIKAILQVGIKREVNLKAVSDYFLAGNTIGSKTFFKGIMKLLPGHYLVAENGKIKTVEYWDIAIKRKERLSEEQCVKSLERCFQGAINKRLKEKPQQIGCHLSGGVDSSLIAAFLVRTISPKLIHAVTLGSSLAAYDEKSYAKSVGKFFGINHVVHIASHNEFMGSLPRLLWHLDEPAIEHTGFPPYLDSKIARKHTTVCFTGYGGDHILAGFKGFTDAYVMSILTGLFDKHRRINRQYLKKSLKDVAMWIKREDKKRVAVILVRSFMELLPNSVRRALKATLFEKKLRKLFSKAFLKEIGGYSPAVLIDEQMRKINGTYFDRNHYYEMRIYFPSFLEIADRVGMAFSILNTHPFVDNEIIDLAVSIPAWLLVKGSRVTKNVSRGLLGWYLPLEHIVKRRKNPFVVPLSEWYRGPLKSVILKILRDPKFRNRKYFDEKFLDKVLTEFFDGKKDHIRLISSLVNFELWHRMFIDPSDVDEKVLDCAHNLLHK